MGIFDFLTQGSGPPSTTTGSTTVGTLPPWYEDYHRNLLAAGMAVGNEDLPLYPNERIALPTGNQIKAWAGAGDFGEDAFAPLSQLALDATGRGAAAFDPSQLQTFMDPYAEQVARIIGEEGADRYQTKFLDPLMDQFTGGGQFGSTRSMDFARQAAEDASREITNAQTKALSQGYSTGMQGYQAFQDLALKGGQQAQNQLKGALDMMEAAGLHEQEGHQKSMDEAYKNFVEQRDYPWKILENLKSLGSNLQIPTGTQQTSVQPYTGAAGNSPLDIIAGIIGILSKPTTTTGTTT